MDDRIISQIEDLGLSNKEARVYVANLMLGSSGVQQIADLSGIKRVTTYVILESLVGLGLVSQSVHAKKTLFNAESPENLKRLLDNREKALRDQMHQLNEIMPDLEGLKSLPKDAPIVKFYEGLEGINAINQTYFDEIRSQNVSETFGISDLDKLTKIFPEIEKHSGNPSRIKANVRSKFIYTSSRGPIMEDSDKEKLRESLYVPHDKFNFDSDISIAGDYVVLISLASSNPIGVVIKSKNIADSMKAIFNLAWESALKYKK